MGDRHTEFFGPDFSRGPYTSSVLETSAVQVAAALAQLRTPLERDDDALRAHADFIRELANRIAPLETTYVNVGTASAASGVNVTFRANVPTRTLLRVWLADEYGGDVTSLTPDTASWSPGVVLQTVVTRAHFIVVTDETGFASLHLDHSYIATWYVGVARASYVFYAGPIDVI